MARNITFATYVVTPPRIPMGSTCEIEDKRKEQEELLGSKALFRRLDHNLKILKIDPLFFYQQVSLYMWRKHFWKRFLKDNSAFETEMILGFLATQISLANPVAQSWLEMVANLKFSPDQLRLGWEAGGRFLATALCVSRLTNLHRPPLNQIQSNCQCQSVYCRCNECMDNLHQAKRMITLPGSHPSSASLTVLAIWSIPFLAMPSLKEISMRRVLELELDQSTLPQTVRRSMREGPQPKLGTRADFMVRSFKCFTMCG